MERSTVIEQAIERAWKDVQELLEQAAKAGYRFYSSRYWRTQLDFNMSDGETYGRGITLPYREWFQERGLRFARVDGFEIKAVIDGRIEAMGIAKNKNGVPWRK